MTFNFLNSSLQQSKLRTYSSGISNKYLTVTFNCCGKHMVLWMFSLTGQSSQYYAIVCVMRVILEQFYPSSLCTIVPGIKQRAWILVKVKICTWKLQDFKNHLWLQLQILYQQIQINWTKLKTTEHLWLWKAY